MNSILEKIIELDKNKEDWSYYDIKEHKNPFLSSQNHSEFIRKYFNKTDKLDEMPKDFKKLFKREKFKRAEHTNSVYFLGCIFYKELDLKILENKNFLFIWFLTVLAHDFAYEYEENFEKYKDTIYSTETLIKKFSIKNNLLSATINPINKISKISKLYLQIKPYFNYRFKQNKIDHGILGGIVLFDSLEKHRKNKFEENNDSFYWGEDLTIDYAHASIAIATHNIWNIQDPDIGLSGIFPISFKDYPLLFLLGIVDTLEPTKTFNCVTADYVFKNILIDFQTNNTIKLENTPKSSLDFTILQEKAKGLVGWLDVDVCIKEKNKIIINIKEN